MITQEEAKDIAANYLQNAGNTGEIEEAIFEESSLIPFGKYKDQELDVYVVSYSVVVYEDPIVYFIYIHSETGEVLYTMGPHGYWE
jgi:hypothetical protein